MTLLKLGVRPTTANLLCLIEAGFNDLKTLVMMKRQSFLKTKLTNPDPEEPFTRVFELCRQHNSLGIGFLEQAIAMPTESNKLKDKCRHLAVKHTKFNTYLQMNPTLKFAQSIYNNIHKL